MKLLFDLFPVILFFATFKFDGMSTTFFHDTDTAIKGFFAIALIRSKRQIDHHQRAFNGSDNRGGVVDHLIKRYGKCGFVSGHHIRGAITH